MSISKELLDHVADADLHLKLSNIDFSTDLREVVTVAHMIEHSENIFLNE